MTFEWEDINGKVMFAAYRADDMVTAITEDGQERLRKAQSGQRYY